MIKDEKLFDQLKSMIHSTLSLKISDNSLSMTRKIIKENEQGKITNYQYDEKIATLKKWKEEMESNLDVVMDKYVTDLEAARKYYGKEEELYNTLLEMTTHKVYFQ